MQTVSIKDIAKFISTGKTPPTKQTEYFGGEVQWYTPGDLDKSKYLKSSNRTLTKLAFSDKKAVSFPSETLLVACIGDIGKLGITTQECSSNQQLTGIKPNSDTDVSYLFYWFKHNKKYVQHIANNAVVPILNNRRLEQVKIPLPPLAEQQKVAAILDAADALRQKDQQLIDHYTTLSQSLFLDMFGDPVTNPMGWEKGTSIDFCKCIVPGRDKPKSFSGSVPWVTTNDLNHLTFTKESRTNIGLTEFEIKNVRAKIIPENSVVLTCVGDLGMVSVNLIPIVVNQQLHTFQCDEKNIMPIFMMFALSYQTPYMKKMSSSTTVPYMNKSICNGIPMIYPPITLQSQFAERIQHIEAQKQQAQACLEQSNNLFNSLLQKAFTGELTEEKES